MTQKRSSNTKEALIQAAFQLFAEKGYAGASTREIASAANTNIASITYHFGGKAGLRTACAETIVERISNMRDTLDPESLPTIVNDTETMFEHMVLRQAYILLSWEEAELMIRFLFREAHEKGAAFEHIYSKFFGPIFGFFHQLFLDATGLTNDEHDETETKIIVFSVIAQIAYFRIGEPVVVRHMGWNGYGPDETLRILSVIQSNVRSIIATHRSPS